MNGATGRGGWPLVPSQTFPGEQALACPKCGSLNITMGCEYPLHGTGSGGRGRLGDPGAKETNTCGTCGHKDRFDGRAFREGR